MKILDQAVFSAAEARPSITKWECSLEDWLTAGHPGDARRYLVRDGNVELRPSKDCPKGEIREAKPAAPRLCAHQCWDIPSLACELPVGHERRHQHGFHSWGTCAPCRGEGTPVHPVKCARRWMISPYHYECYRSLGHIGLCVAANEVKIPGATGPTGPSCDIAQPGPRFPNCEACEPKHAEARQIIADLRERLEFCHAGNATLRECGADTARKLGVTRRQLADEKETSSRMQRERDNADEVNAKLRGDLKSAMTCSAVTNGPLGPIRCERLRGDDHGQKHVGGGKEWKDDFSGPEFDCDECKEKDAKVVGLERQLKRLARDVIGGGPRCSKRYAITPSILLWCVRNAGHDGECWWTDTKQAACGLRWLDATAWHECTEPKGHECSHRDAHRANREPPP